MRWTWKGVPATKPPVSEPYSRLKGCKAAQAGCKIPRWAAFLLQKHWLTEVAHVTKK